MLNLALQSIENHHIEVGNYSANNGNNSSGGNIHTAMCKLHGYTSFVSMLFHSSDSSVVDKKVYRHVFAIAESLAMRQYDDQMSGVSVSLVCTCVKGAHTLFSALLSFGGALASK